MVKPFPFAVALLHRSPVVPLHRTCIAAARLLTTPCLAPARPGTDVGHQCGASSTLHASPSLLAASEYMTCIFSMSINVHIFMVNLPPPPSATPQKRFQHGEMWASTIPCVFASLRYVVHPLAVVGRQSSVVAFLFHLHAFPPMWGNVGCLAVRIQTVA